MSMGLYFELDLSGIDKFLGKVPGRASEFLDKEAELVTNDIRNSFGTSPSPPGGPPGVDTGNLRAGMIWEQHEALVRWIISQAEYAVFLEVGTSRMAARPFMGPAFERLRSVYEAHAKGMLE